MKALVCRAFGAVAVETRPDPTPQSGEVRVRVQAAGINFPDALMIEGKYQGNPDPPFVPGSEIAGFVEASRDEEFKPGDRVFGLTSLNGFAQRVCVPARRLQHAPPAMTFEQAAAFPLAYGAAAHALFDRARLKVNETVLILGAGGGVGLAATEIAKRAGARVLAVDLDQARAETAKARGADAAAPAGDLRGAADAFSNGGVDVILDAVGGELGETAVRMLAWRGRYLVFGFASGAVPKIRSNLLLLKGAEAIGVYWGAFQKRGEDNDAANFKTLLGWWAEGALKPSPAHIFRLEEAADAMKAMLRHELSGKAVIAMDDG